MWSIMKLSCVLLIIAAKKLESMSAEDLIWETKVEFIEFGLPKNLFQMRAQILSQNILRNFAGV